MPRHCFIPCCSQFLLPRSCHFSSFYCFCWHLSPCLLIMSLDLNLLTFQGYMLSNILFVWKAKAYLLYTLPGPLHLNLQCTCPLLSQSTQFFEFHNSCIYILMIMQHYSLLTSIMLNKYMHCFIQFLFARQLVIVSLVLCNLLYTHFLFNHELFFRILNLFLTSS